MQYYIIRLAHIKVSAYYLKIFVHRLILTDEAVLASDSSVVDKHVYTTQALFDPMEYLQNIILVTQITKLWIQSFAAFVFCRPFLHKLKWLPLFNARPN
jgi:hypothetical protein